MNYYYECVWMTWMCAWMAVCVLCNHVAVWVCDFMNDIVCAFRNYWMPEWCSRVFVLYSLAPIHVAYIMLLFLPLHKYSWCISFRVQCIHGMRFPLKIIKSSEMLKIESNPVFMSCVLCTWCHEDLYFRSNNTYIPKCRMVETARLAE